MYNGRFLIPYDISMQYVDGFRRGIYHNFSQWGNEMIVVLEGEAIFCRDSLQFPVREGDVFVLTGDYTKQIMQAKKLRLCSIFYRESAILRTENTFHRLAGYQMLFLQNPVSLSYESEHLLHADEMLLADLRSLTARMELEQYLKEPGYEQLLNSSFFMIVTLVSRAFAMRELFEPQSVSSLTKTLMYIQQHYREKITLQELAQMAQMSTRNYSRKFQELYHQSPAQYIIVQRMRRACALLEESQLTISEVALECGYNDINYFSKFFHKTVGSSPTAYRNNRLLQIQSAQQEEDSYRNEAEHAVFE